ncbi:unnamed protein product [Ectocarpus sp. 12 AP-2014]
MTGQQIALAIAGTASTKNEHSVYVGSSHSRMPRTSRLTAFLQMGSGHSGIPRTVTTQYNCMHRRRHMRYNVESSPSRVTKTSSTIATIGGTCGNVIAVGICSTMWREAPRASPN